MKFLTNLDLQQNQLIKAVVQNIASLDGVAGVDGQIIYNTGDNLLYIYKGDDETGAWEAVGNVLSVNGQTGDVVLNLDDIHDVTITDIASGEVLKWNGTAWVNNTLVEAGIQALDEDLTAIAALTGTSGLLKKTAANTWTLDTNSYSLTSHNHTLDSLSNVTVTDNTSGEILKWNGSAWVNNTLVEAGIEPADSTILKDADIGVSVQAYNANTVIDGSYVHTDNNYTTTEKSKLAGIAAGAEVNVNADWNASSGDAQILNKPTTVSGYGITDVYTKTEINTTVSGLDGRLDDLEAIDHTQNTDTGTTSATFQLDSGNSGLKLKNSAGELQIRNAADGAYADLRVKDLYVEGTTTTINSNNVNIGDSIITLNADITAHANNSDGGIEVKLLDSSDVANNPSLYYSASGERWLQTFGDVEATLVSATVAAKLAATIGNGTDHNFVITHNLNTRDLVVNIRENGDDYELVQADVTFTSADTITVSFAGIPATNQYRVTIIG